MGSAIITFLAALAVQDAEAGGWIQRAFLKAPAPTEAGYYGRAVALSGSTLVVGAIGDPSMPGGGDPIIRSGSVFVYTRTATGPWELQAQLKASNPDPEDLFGVSVAISGDTIVVGATGEAGANNEFPRSGAAYVFTRAGGVWTQQAYLKSSRPVQDAAFGVSVSIDRDTIAVGANYDVAMGVTSGTAYVFERTAGTWTERAILFPENRNPEDHFGMTVGLSGGTLIVGAIGDDGSTEAMDAAGAAYIFARDNAGAWGEQATLRASNAESKDSFGYCVSISGDRAIVGAVGEDGPGNALLQSGAVYVFARFGSTWTEEAYLKASNAEGVPPTTSLTSPLNIPDFFGRHLAISGDLIVVGAMGEDSGTGDPADNSVLQAGAAYVFARSGTTWTQQAYLKSPDPGRTDVFGFGVAVDGVTVAVGSYLEDGVNDSIPNSGAAFIFRPQLPQPPSPVAIQSDAAGDPIQLGSGTHGAIIFGALPLTGPYAALNHLEIEVKPVGRAFDGLGLIGGLTPTELPFGNYHWRCRHVNEETASPWTDFGGNDDGVDVIRYNLTPATGDAVQLRDGKILAAGAVLIEGETIEFRASGTDPDGDEFAMEVEVARVGTAFTGRATQRSEPHRSFGRFVLAAQPEPGDYLWQHRVVDSFGAASAWIRHGAGSADFSVLAIGSEGTDCLATSAPRPCWIGCCLLAVAAFLVRP